MMPENDQSIAEEKPPRTSLRMRITAGIFATLILAGVLLAPLIVFGKAALIEVEEGAIWIGRNSVQYVSEASEFRVAPDQTATLIIRGGARVIVQGPAYLKVREEGKYAFLELLAGELEVRRTEHHHQCLLATGPFVLTLDEPVEAGLHALDGDATQTPEPATLASMASELGARMRGGQIAKGGVLLRCAPNMASRVAQHPEYAPLQLFDKGVRLVKGNGFGEIAGTPFVFGPGMALPSLPDGEAARK